MKTRFDSNLSGSFAELHERARRSRRADAESGKTQGHDPSTGQFIGDGMPGNDPQKILDTVARIKAGTDALSATTKLDSLIRAAPDTAEVQKPEALERAKTAAFERMDRDPEFAARVQALANADDIAIGNELDEPTALANLVNDAVPDANDWQHTANDSDPDSIATQLAAAREFGGDKGYIDNSVNNMMATLPGMIGYFESLQRPEVAEIRQVGLRAEYDHTQAWLREQGIGPNDPVTLYRGDGRGFYVRDEDVDPIRPGEGMRSPHRGETIHADLNPLSSWSTDRDQAESFISNGGTLMKTTVPADRIFSTAATGWGSWGEREVIIIGKDGVDAVVEDHYSSYGASVTAAAKPTRIRLDDEDNEDWIKKLAQRKTVSAVKQPIVVRVKHADAESGKTQPHDELGRFSETDGGGSSSAVERNFDRLPADQQQAIIEYGKKWGLDLDEMTRRAELHLEHAMQDPAVVEEGRTWYSQMADEANARADALGYDRDEFLTIVAATSVKNPWDYPNQPDARPNLESASMFARMLQDNPEMRDMDPKAAAQMAKENGWLSSRDNPYSENNGRLMVNVAAQTFERIGGDPNWSQKTGAFHEQLVTRGNGDTTAVDTHMVAALAGVHETTDEGRINAPRSTIDTHVLDGPGTGGAKGAAKGWSERGTAYTLFDKATRDATANHNARTGDNLTTGEAQALIWVDQRDHRLEAIPEELRRDHS